MENEAPVGKLLLPIAHWRSNLDEESLEVTLKVPLATLTKPGTRHEFAKAVRPAVDQIGKAFWEFWGHHHPKETR